MRNRASKPTKENLESSSSLQGDLYDDKAKPGRLPLRGLYSTLLVVLIIVLVLLFYPIRGNVYVTKEGIGNTVYTMNKATRSEFKQFDTSSFGVFQKMDICIATLSIVGPSRNGGIATAYTALAHALVKQGHSVTVLYLGGNTVQGFQSIEYWVEHYKTMNINLVPLPKSNVKLSYIFSSKHIEISYLVYRWFLEAPKFNVIHFHEWHGVGYYTSLAKQQGIVLHDTVIWTTIHCPTLFYIDGNSQYLSSPNYLVSDFLEKKSVEYSDIVVSPSLFMLNWVQQNGWVLPRHTFWNPNLLPDSVLDRSLPKSQNKSNRINEVVFFGRLEVLKGFYTFCDMLDLMSSTNAWPIIDGVPLKVSFLGSGNLGGDISASKVIMQRYEQGNWGSRPNIHLDLLQNEAVEYLLQDTGKLAIMPSFHENSPYAVLECLALHIRFLASDTGGTKELIHERFHENVLFDPKLPSSIFEKVIYALENGVPIAEPSFDIMKNHRLWIDFHNGVMKFNRITKQFKSSPLVSVCIAHRNRDHQLWDSVNSVLQQTYSNYELIIVDDQSTDPESLTVLNDIEVFFKVKRDGYTSWPSRVLVERLSSNMFPGYVRNHAVSLSRGQYVLFLDDDDVAKPNWMSVLVYVSLYTHADIVTNMVDLFTSDMNIKHNITKPSERRWIPVGDALDLGFFTNVYGAYSALVKRSVFLSIGGYSQEKYSTFEDYEFFTKALLKGCTLQLVPEALLWYRQNSKNHLMENTSLYANRMRALRPIIASSPSHLRNILLFSHSQHFYNAL